MILQGPILTPLRQAREQDDDQTSSLSLKFPSPNFITQTKPLHQTMQPSKFNHIIDSSVQQSAQQYDEQYQTITAVKEEQSEIETDRQIEAWQKEYLGSQKRKQDLKRLIIDCSTQQIRAKKLVENFDIEFSEFGKYMNKFQKYVDFKEKHPYSETHPDFEADNTPTTILNIDQMKMDSYFPSEQSRSAHFSQKIKL